MPLQEISNKKLLQLLSTCVHHPKPLPHAQACVLANFPFGRKVISGENITILK